MAGTYFNKGEVGWRARSVGRVLAFTHKAPQVLATVLLHKLGVIAPACSPSTKKTEDKSRRILSEFKATWATRKTLSQESKPVIHTSTSGL